MAQVENPGAKPVGASQDDSQQNPNTVPVGGGKIAGKFESVEELAKGYLGLEQGYKDLAAKFGEVTRVLEVIAEPIVEARSRGNNQNPGYGVPVGRAPNGGYDPYGRGAGPNNSPDYIDPADFMTNPGAHLRAREDQLVERMSQKVTEVVLNANVVNNFKAANQDLVPHERIVNAFMRDQDQRLPLATRLDNAGKATRDYFASLKVKLNQDLRQNAPTGDNFIEGPGGGVRHGGAPETPQADEGEQALIDYINERHQQMADHFGLGEGKK